MGDDLYGTDIQMTIDGDLQAAPRGDLALITGLDNLDQANTNRLLTLPEEFLFGPYGCTLKAAVDSVDPTVTNALPTDVKASLLDDSRNADVMSVNVTQDSSGSITVQCAVVSAFGDTSSLEVTT